MKTIIFDLDGTLVRLKPELVLLADLKQLQTLKKDYALALVSGGTKEEVLRALEETKLRSLFDDKYVVTFEDTNQEKSSGEPFCEIRRRLSGSMVMIGDSDADEVGTTIAGIPFVRVKIRPDVEEQKAELEAAIDLARNRL